MRQIRFSVATSLDGYIAGPHGEYDWIVMDPDIDFSAMSARFDTVLLGRKSYEVTREQGGGPIPGMETIVFSRTLRQSDCEGVRVSHDLPGAIASLRDAPGKDMWLFGGGELFRSALDLGLVDSVEIAIVPLLLGGGIPLLPHPAARTGLSLARHHVYPKTGTILLEYDVLR